MSAEIDGHDSSSDQHPLLRLQEILTSISKVSLHVTLPTSLIALNILKNNNNKQIK